MADDSRTETSSQVSSPGDDHGSVDSGFVSPSTSTVSLPRISLTQPHLKHLNKQLESLHPMEILRFCKIFFPNLYQSTAFGLTGLVTVDMLSKIDAESADPQPVDLIFLDTLYHFKETYELVERVKQRYNVKVHVFKPADVSTVEEFEKLYGEKLYEESSELYDWIAKVEPLQRAYSELKVAAVLTGRRRSQGGQRGDIAVVEVDDERGVVKINPLANWTFAQVKAYIDEHKVPYNALLDRGYKSVGDWHSTVPVGEGEDERAGRWKGQDKTECGIHNKQSRYAKWLQQSALLKQQKQQELQEPQQQQQQQEQQQQQVQVQVQEVQVRAALFRKTNYDCITPAFRDGCGVGVTGLFSTVSEGSLGFEARWRSIASKVLSSG